MTTEEALQFLQQHQPMPATSECRDDLIGEFDQVRRYFMEIRDERCVPLFLNAFGEGDGHGVYQLVEDIILLYPREIVIPELKKALENPRGSVRYWSAQIAVHYPGTDLVPPLLALLREGSTDEMLAAVYALEWMPSAEVHQELEAALGRDIADEVKNLIRSVLYIKPVFYRDGDQDGDQDRPTPILIQETWPTGLFRWPDTGEEFYATMPTLPGDPMPPPLEERDDVRLVVILRDKGQMARQLATLRDLVVAMRDRKVSDIMQEAKRTGEVDLGVHYYWSAADFVKEAQSKGLEIEMRPLS